MSMPRTYKMEIPFRAPDDKTALRIMNGTAILLRTVRWGVPGRCILTDTEGKIIINPEFEADHGGEETDDRG